MATNNPSGTGCNTVGYDENYKGRGGDGYHYSSIKNSVFHNENNQKD